jgi:hypothetical protein
MKTSELLLSSLNITEDDYSYKGLFILGNAEKTKHMDMADLENEAKLADLKAYFDLEESTNEIKKSVMEMIFEKSHISSIIKEGEDYEENSKRKKTERLANTFDMA